MHFKYPELLYALFLLVIPVLVHLFQLRRFKTEKFTNVKFLRKAVKQTRQSARLKKWLILFNRLLLLVGIIVAFAQPYLPPSEGEVRKKETIIYLDNSLSMQAKGKNGILLRQGIQQLLENLPQEGEVSVFTNNEEFNRLSTASLRKKLQQIEYSPGQLEWQSVRLKAQGMTPEKNANFIAISDFQYHRDEDSLLPLPNLTNYLVPMRPQNINNISLDSMYVSPGNPDEFNLTATLNAYGNFEEEEVALSIFNGQNLLARKTVAVKEGVATEVTFTLPAGAIKNGRLSFQDNGLHFDNELFFSINPTAAINVVAIGSQKVDFLSRIFTEPEFKLTSFSEGNVDFSQLSTANLVILNEPISISFPLGTELQKLKEEKVILVVIPSAEAEINTYNRFLRELGLPVLAERMDQERLITRIAFSHPLYRPVFDEQVKNFQYPAVQEYFRFSQSVSPVLAYNSGEPFLIEKNGVFLFSAPLNNNNTNFQGSPLIVPTFYNMANLALSPGQLYYKLGEEKMISLPVNLQQDKILKLVSEDFSYIPRQQSFQNKVQLFLENDMESPGHYEVMKDTTSVKTLAFNLDRRESKLKYRELTSQSGFRLQRDIPQVITEIRSQGEVAALWKWFVIFALVFLLTEMLILKYFK